VPVGRSPKHLPPLGQCPGPGPERRPEITTRRVADSLLSQNRRRATRLQRYFEGRIDHWVKELRKVGVTLKLFWEEYKVLQVSRYNETQSYRSCMGVLSLVKKYGPDRLEAASARLRPAGRGRGAFPIRPQPLNDRVYHS
jgi:hypothetical protein